jgi:tetratricopeptide (TPR) repeat protein
MFEEGNDQFDEQFSNELQKFETMQKNGDAFYFDPEVLEQIIDHYIIKNQFKTAGSAINFALSQHPTHNTFNLKKAQIFSTTGQLKESLLILQTLEKIDPFNSEVFITIATVFSQLRDHNKAIKYLEKALSLTSESEDNEELIEIMLDLALEYENILDFHNAIKVLERLLDISTNNESGIYEIAYCYERIGDFDKCIEFYNLYIDNNPYSFTAWYNLGNIYFLKNNIEKALWAYDYAIIINDNFASAHFNMGNTYMQTEDYPKAIDSYLKCLEIDPDDSLTLCYLGEAYERTKDFTSALAYYTKSKEIEPTLADAWLGIGIVLDLQNQTQKSISYFQQAVKLKGDNANYYHVLGEALFKLERFAEAELVLEKALVYDPSYGDAMELLAKIKKEYNLFEAIDFLIQTSQNSPLDINCSILLVSLFWENGQKLDALELFKNQFAVNPKESINFLLLHLPESKQIQDFNNIINPNND